jgi:hypothetical protein
MPLETIHETQIAVLILDTRSQVDFTGVGVSNAIINLCVQDWFVGWSFQL